MVGKFKALQPDIEIHQAAAHALPFDDSSVDAVCAAQASLISLPDMMGQAYRMHSGVGYCMNSAIFPKMAYKYTWSGMVRFAAFD